MAVSDIVTSDSALSIVVCITFNIVSSSIFLGVLSSAAGPVPVGH